MTGRGEIERIHTACLHLGEPSCSHYNKFLDRRVLSGRTGYLSTLDE